MMASAEKPSAVILKARRKLTKALQGDLELTLNVAKYYPFLTRNEFYSLRQIKDPEKTTEILFDTVLRKGEAAHRQFLECLEKLRHVLPSLQPISGYFENGEDPWEMTICNENPTEKGLPEKVKPDIIWSSSQNNNKYYRLESGRRRFLRCAYTDLAFDTKEDVTLTYQFDSWPQNLKEGKTEELSIGGPLFIIEADSKEAVKAIHFPHFLCLSGEENANVRIAYLARGEVSLEKPDHVGPSHVEVKSPRYCPGGVVLKKPSHQQEIKVHAVALLYQALPASSPTFHLYLLPNDLSWRKMVHEQEVTNHSKRIPKPPDTTKPLVFGSDFFVQGSLEIEVCPKVLKFKNLHASMEQPYIEVYAENLQDKLDLSLIEKSKDEAVWTTRIRQNELMSSGLFSAQVMSSGPKTIRDHLESVLWDMNKTDLKRFKNKLSEFPIQQGFNNIPRGRLEEADALDLSKLLVETYAERYAVEVTVGVLHAIDLKHQANKLLRLSGFEKPSSLTTAHNKSNRNGGGNVSYPMVKEEKADVLPGSSTERALDEEKASEDEMICKERNQLAKTVKMEQYDAKVLDDKSTVSSQLLVTKGKRTAVTDLLVKLKLQKYKSKKLTLKEVLEINSGTLKHNAPQSLEDLPWHFLRKIFALNVTARSTRLAENQPRLEDRMSSLSSWAGVEDSVNPLDVLCAVLLCSDSFLQQEIFSRMSLCQFALPLLLPPLESPKCTLMLWAMRDIVKQWRPHSLADSRDFRLGDLVGTPMPTIAFMRMGRPALSKSKLLNELLSSTHQNHDFCIHRDMEGGNVSRGIADGLVEIAWYFPGGQKGLDLFSEPLAIANLRGDIVSHQAQFGFLTRVSSAVFIIAERIGEKEYALLSSLMEPSVQYYLILDGGSRTFEGTYAFAKKLLGQRKATPLWILVKSASTNMADFVKNIRSVVHRTMCSRLKPIAVKDMIAASCDHNILVDEDSEECQNARECAENVIEKIKDVANYWKEPPTFLENLWKKQSSPEGESSLLTFQEQVNEFTSRLFGFIRNLQTTEIHYFFKWCKFHLERISRVHLASFQKETQMSTSPLGDEHFIHEMGRYYEAHSRGYMPSYVKSLSQFPNMVANLMLEDFPLQLFDGDAFNTPLRWITDVLAEVHHKLEGRSRMMAITVLGVPGTGKSTLLNTMFGLQFAVNRSQQVCGAFMAFLKVSQDLAEDLCCDVVAVIDTEGLKSPPLVKAEGSDWPSKNHLASLVAGLSDIAIVNMAMENTTEIKDVLQTVACAFFEMRTTGQKPNCQFVHQNVSDVSAHEQNMWGRRHLLEELDGMIQATAKIYGVDQSVRFSDIMDYDPETHNWYIPGLWQGVQPMAQVNRGYSEKVVELKKHLFGIIKSRSRRNPPKDIPQFTECFRNLWRL